MKIETLIALKENEGMRLDKFISSSALNLSRTRIQQLIETGMISLLPARRISSSLKIKAGDQIIVTIPPVIEADPVAQSIPLDILYEDAHVLVLNKPAGLVVHPAPGHRDSTLVNALLGYCADSLSGIGGVKRPGIVHRLDKDTSGLMVVAKTDTAHHSLTAQFSDRSLSRTYQCLVWGIPSPMSGTIQTLIGRDPKNRQKMAVVNKGGREAITHYKILKKIVFSEGSKITLSLVECQLATGRTHQIRVHMRFIGCPIVGDPLYGHWPKGIKKVCGSLEALPKRQMLHAHTIKFIHPILQENKTFSCALPEDMEEFLKFVEKNIKP